MMTFGIVGFLAILLLVCYLMFSKSESAPSNNNIQSGGGSSQSSSGGMWSGYKNGKGGKNNPGFLSQTSTNWQGECEPLTGCRFENFSSLYYGIRAWYVNLFGKVKKGTITSTSSMIDVLTPKGNENKEAARNAYKSYVAKATNWIELGRIVFNTEANPDWKNCPESEREQALQQGFSAGVEYRYGKGNVPPFFKS